MKDIKKIILDLLNGSASDLKKIIEEIKNSYNGNEFSNTSLFMQIKDLLIKEGYPENQVNVLIENSIKDLCLDIVLDSNKIRLPHKCSFKPLTKKELADEWMSVSAVCTQCNKYYGWRCKKSPDGVCHYFTQPKGKSVPLIDGTYDNKKFKTKNYNQEYETEDLCLYCGHPDERK